MSRTRKTTRTELHAHSRAKVELYEAYLSRYVRILGQLKWLRRLFILDLFCGEGLYDDGNKGSALVGVEVVARIAEEIPDIADVELWLNDPKESEVEPGISVKNRLDRILQEKVIPPSVTIFTDSREFDKVLPVALSHIKTIKESRSLFFLDPHGYKEWDPRTIRTIMGARGSDLILFVPISHMYRFCNSERIDDFSGFEHLSRTLHALFGDKLPYQESVDGFIESLRGAFQLYLGGSGLFVDTFRIEGQSTNIYALFFFTRHEYGFEKMLEAKWKVDETEGRGFKLASLTGDLFAPLELNRDYYSSLRDYILEADGGVDNTDIYRFGLKNLHLPKHSRIVLDQLIKKDRSVVKIPQDEQSTKGYYIKSKATQRVIFRRA